MGANAHSGSGRLEISPKASVGLNANSVAIATFPEPEVKIRVFSAIRMPRSS